MNRANILNILILIVLILMSLSLGSVNYSINEIIEWNDEVNTIITSVRLPRTISAIIVGIGLSLSGLLLQTLFRNPLAGPSVIGISSGASLGVAIAIMASSVLGLNIISSSFSQMIFAGAGAMVVLVILLLFAKKVKSTVSLLLIGVMMGYLSSSIISILSFITDKNSLQEFVFWGYGSLTKVFEINEFIILSIVIIVGLSITIINAKSIDVFLLNENYAKSMGVNTNQVRIMIILIAGITAGVITSMYGPIGFIGISTPHIVRIIYRTSNHRKLIIGSVFIGPSLLLFCDIIARLPGVDSTIPLNSVTSLVGAPLIMYLLLRK